MNDVTFSVKRSSNRVWIVFIARQQRQIKSLSALVHNYCYKFRSRFSSATISCLVGFAWQVKKSRDYRKNIVEYYKSWIPEATVSRRWFALTWTRLIRDLYLETYTRAKFVRFFIRSGGYARMRLMHFS